MKLAHEVIVGGQLGAKKTVDRMSSNFHWPGLLLMLPDFVDPVTFARRLHQRAVSVKYP